MRAYRRILTVYLKLKLNKMLKHVAYIPNERNLPVYLQNMASKNLKLVMCFDVSNFFQTVKNIFVVVLRKGQKSTGNAESVFPNLLAVKR